jgi:phosphoglycolate phosphatase-like HAD superfamily hydrolase
MHLPENAPLLGSSDYEGVEMTKAAIFDLDGTILDSVDLHALAWQEAMAEFGHDVTFEHVRSQIGKGADKLIPVFLSKDDQRDHGKELDEWRAQRFKSTYLPLIRPFSAVPNLLRRVREAGLVIAIATCPKRDDLGDYLAIAGIADLVDVATSAEDVKESKPAPDVFEVALKKLGVEPNEAIAIGDTPWDAIAASKAGIPTIGVLCGGHTETTLREAGCFDVYPGLATLYARFDETPLAR